jgi:3'-5' exonuclease
VNIYMDLESIPCQCPDLLGSIRAEMKAELDEALASLRAPSNYRDEAKIAEYINTKHAELVVGHEAKVQDAILKTSFDGGLGQICVIGWAIDDAEPFSYHVADLTPASERKLMQDFFCVLTDAYSQDTTMCFVGHNILGFDIRFIWQRAIVLGVKPPRSFPRDPKPWGDSTFDTMLAWNGLKPGGSMEKLCRIFGIPGKGDMDGSKVWPMVQAGQIEAVAAYCRGDVERTRALHRRMTFVEA